MDSGNWRVKREPSETPPAWPSSRPREQNSRGPQRDHKPRWGSGHGEQRDYSNSPRALEQIYQHDGLRKPINDVKTALSIEEGRRLYVGNLPYEATTKDIESLFKDVAEGIEAINISVDPMTGRNPSYCFVDFVNSELAYQVMEEYNSQNFLGRPLKVKPGVKSGTGTGRFDVRARHLQTNRERNDAFSFDRWRRLEHPEDISKAGEEGRRVYVGGLPRFDSQPDANMQLRELFGGFDVQVVSKMISVPEEKRFHQGHHNYCFVDLASKEEAQRAVNELDGKDKWGCNIKASISNGISRKLAERRRLFVSGLPEFSSQQATEDGIRELFKGFDVSSISKLCLPRDLSEGTDGHCFCFVELSNSEETDRAMAELDWTEMWGGKVRVKPATNSRR